MTTRGIEAVFLETHNWGKTAKFFQELGFEVEFTTDHGSGRLRNGDGVSIFLVEIPEDRVPQTQVALTVAAADADDPDAFRFGPAVEAVSPFQETHYGTREMIVRDPDGRTWSLQAPGKN